MASPELKAFCKDMLSWIDAGCPINNQHKFVRDDGLCWNIREWVYSNLPAHGIEQKRSAWVPLRNELIHSFTSQGLKANYPFNRNGPEYDRESALCVIFTNPQRLAWLKKHAE